MSATIDRAARALGAKRRRGAPRAGARRTLLHTIRQIPNYLRLLGGLLTDRRVSRLDKMLVGAAIAYVVMPIDLVPDFIPFFGQIDDVYLLILAVQRLVANAGTMVVAEHWAGEPEALTPGGLRAVLSAAAFFLPRRMRKRLRGIARKR